MQLSTHLKGALNLLLQAYNYAEDSGSSQWDFAVSLDEFRTLGLNENDLRWLVKKHAVEHAREVTREFDDGREFRATGKLTFSRRTCFILTDCGVRIANSLQTAVDLPGKEAVLQELNGSSPFIETCGLSGTPNWDVYMRKLYLGGSLVKRYKWPAQNQEAVLCAFEEEGWPHRIDDPLPPQPEQDSKRRLADTIKCLNRKQVKRLICFRGDGTGEGVIWETMSAGSDRNGDR